MNHTTDLKQAGHHHYYYYQLYVRPSETCVWAGCQAKQNFHDNTLPQSVLTVAVCGLGAYLAGKLWSVVGGIY